MGGLKKYEGSPAARCMLGIKNTKQEMEVRKCRKERWE